MYPVSATRKPSAQISTLHWPTKAWSAPRAVARNLNRDWTTWFDYHLTLSNWPYSHGLQYPLTALYFLTATHTHTHTHTHSHTPITKHAIGDIAEVMPQI